MWFGEDLWHKVKSIGGKINPALMLWKAVDDGNKQHELNACAQKYSLADKANCMAVVHAKYDGRW